jgi:hypothetical protein
METIEVDQPGGPGGVVRITAFFDDHYAGELSVTQENVSDLIMQLCQFQNHGPKSTAE